MKFITRVYCSRPSLLLVLLLLKSQNFYCQVIQGPSSSQKPFYLPQHPSCKMISVLTCGDSVKNYRLAGPPDGMGVFAEDDSTFSVLVNHEISSSMGIPRLHGSSGSFVSVWRISRNNFRVLNGEDLVRNVYLWNGNGYILYNAANPSPQASFNRFCSSDLAAPIAYSHTATGKGTPERILTNGEEYGEGRAFAHLVTGANAGNSYQLPAFGRASFENIVTCPRESEKTLTAALDDSYSGQVYFYLGTKSNSGSEIQKAGLQGGSLFALRCPNLQVEGTMLPARQFTFNLARLGNVSGLTGAALNQLSNDSLATVFLRPEDGSWDPSHTNDFYFNTTNSFSGPSRLWKASFADLDNPAAGGTLTAVLDGTEGQHMLDNLCIVGNGDILLQEDPGGTLMLARIWKYSLSDKSLVLAATADSSRFSPGPAFLTYDEESSGIISLENFLGKGWYMFAVQVHTGMTTEINEYGQLLLYYDATHATAITKPDMGYTGVYLYPNPTQGQLTCVLPATSGLMKANICDATGRAIQNFTLKKIPGNSQMQFDLSQVPDGLYYLTLGDELSTYHKAISVQH